MLSNKESDYLLTMLKSGDCKFEIKKIAFMGPETLNPEKYETISSWRLLKRGMSESEVRSTLGEPHKIDGGALAFWHYKNGGTVTFYQDKVHSWSEPR